MSGGIPSVFGFSNRPDFISERNESQEIDFSARATFPVHNGCKDGVRKTARISASQSFQLCGLMRLLQVSNNVLFTA